MLYEVCCLSNNKDYVSQLSHFTRLHFSFVSLVFEWSDSQPGQFILGEGAPPSPPAQYPLDERLGGTQSRFGHCGFNIFFPLPRIEPSGPVQSYTRYTDWAVPGFLRICMIGYWYNQSGFHNINSRSCKWLLQYYWNLIIWIVFYF
jgi:hypothetical protein